MDNFLSKIFTVVGCNSYLYIPLRLHPVKLHVHMPASDLLFKPRLPACPQTEDTVQQRLPPTVKILDY